MKAKKVAFATLVVIGCGLAPAQVWNHNPAANNGPINWGAVSPLYATCGSRSGMTLSEVGMKQSPITIVSTSAVEATLPSLSFRYRPTPLDVENTGHVVEVPYERGSTLRLDRSVTSEYELVQFHFHAPSEHTLDGKRYDLEMHLVHQNRLSDLAVVGVLMAIGPDPNPLVDAIMGNAPLTVGTNKVEGAEINVREMLPRNRSYFTYSGSLTTPPCSEGVRWIVLRQPVNVSDFAVQANHNVVSKFPGYDNFRDNNRPVLPLHSRTVLFAR